MVESQPQIASTLQNLVLFKGLLENEIEQIASRFSRRSLQPGEVLFTGRRPRSDLYIVLSGKIFVLPEFGEPPVKIVHAGDFFDEEGLLYGEPDSAVITTDQFTELLHLEEEDFYWLLRQYPQIKPSLSRTPENQELIRRGKFDWLGDDELIVFLERKHKAIFIYGLLGPVILYLISLSIVFLIAPAEVSASLWAGGVLCAGTLAFLATLWGIWGWIDWGNDYYIVTNHRVVLVEKVIFLYESRDEAPLNTILAVNVMTPFIGRLLGYGSVAVRTFTGEIMLRNLPNPNRLAAIIEEYRYRLQMGRERGELRRIDEAIQTRILKRAESTSPSLSISKSGNLKPGEPSRLARFFSNFFTMRFEEGNIITYRKYWPTLFGKIWIPTLGCLVTIIVLVHLLNVQRNEQITTGAFALILLIDAALLLFIFIPWWFYKYLDWRNDIYQVTDKYIFDIERKPFGTEMKKSAPLENILSLEHERLGILGYLLNFGFVTINVGETKFVFREVHDPARVQQDIFNRIIALRQAKEESEAAHQRQQFVDVLDIYYHNVEEPRIEEDFDEFYEDDFGVE